MEKKYKVNCIQISGKNNLLFNGGDEVTSSQLNESVEKMLKGGCIVESEKGEAKTKAPKKVAPKKAAPKKDTSKSKKK